MGFPTKNDHFGVFWGYHNLRKHPEDRIMLGYLGVCHSSLLKTADRLIHTLG